MTPVLLTANSAVTAAPRRRQFCFHQIEPVLVLLFPDNTGAAVTSRRQNWCHSFIFVTLVCYNIYLMNIPVSFEIRYSSRTLRPISTVLQNPFKIPDPLALCPADWPQPLIDINDLLAANDGHQISEFVSRRASSQLPNSSNY